MSSIGIFCKGESSIGVFREREIDGKLFHIYSFQSQTDLPTSSSSSGVAAIDSGGDTDSSLQPLFLCPRTRSLLEGIKRREDGYDIEDEDEDDIIPMSTSPHFPNIKDLDEEVVQLLFDPDHPRRFPNCKLPLVPKDSDEDDEFICYICKGFTIDGSSYYCCPKCPRKFHKECVEAPLFIKHPSYPFLSLKLSISSGTHLTCFSCEKTIYRTFYYSPTYNLSMHPFCAMKPIPIFIDHPKRHHHPLTFFPKQNSLVCSVCGQIKELIPTYVCARCVFVVHQDCIYFPYVIRICRHQHRISFTSSLPSEKLSCGVCRQMVDNSCGAYSCNKCPNYFVHSRCATREDLWDGEELEGVPEEPEIVVEPFKMIADGIILHFSHDHHLKLEISRNYDDEKFCQACVLPIYEGNYYSCIDHCAFILHEACARSPLKIHHPLHACSLGLEVVTNGYEHEGAFRCNACWRRSSGFFVYYGSKTGSLDFRLDLRCASVSEPFNYEGHKHPLFLALSPKEEKLAICQICKDPPSATEYYYRKLNCIECHYVLCFRCATLPYKAMYKHDKHFLTFREVDEAGDESGWCDVCERIMVYSREKGFYSCDDYCCTTLHVDCLLGKDPYMKPGQTIEIKIKDVLVLRNSTMSRPRCHHRTSGEHRCPHRVLFKTKGMSFCSYACAFSSLKSPFSW